MARHYGPRQPCLPECSHHQRAFEVSKIIQTERATIISPKLPTGFHLVAEKPLPTPPPHPAACFPVEEHGSGGCQTGTDALPPPQGQGWVQGVQPGGVQAR